MTTSVQPAEMPVAGRRNESILLVKPDGVEHVGHSDPPLGLLYLAAALREAGFPVAVVDGFVVGRAGLEAAFTRLRPRLVGMTAMTPSRHRALDFAAWVKAQDPAVTTVLGGPHPTIMWRQLVQRYPQVDVCVLGEGEDTLVEIARGEPLESVAGLAYRRRGVAVRTRPRPPRPDLDSLPLPAWDLVDLTAYPPRPPAGAKIVGGLDLTQTPRVPIIFSRGCTGRCTFCSSWWVWRGWRHRSPENTLREIKLLYLRHGARHFAFEDDTFSADPSAAAALCDAIVAERLPIAWFATTRVVCVDADLLARMRAAGCYGVSYGIESASPAVLAALGKDTDAAQAERAIRLAKEAGLRVTCLLIIGGPGESRGTLNETISLLRRARPDEVGTVGSLWVFPGTRIYRDLKAAGVVNDDFWLGPEPYFPYPGPWSKQDLAEFGEAIYRRRTLNLPRLVTGRARHALGRALRPHLKQTPGRALAAPACRCSESVR